MSDCVNKDEVVRFRDQLSDSYYRTLSFMSDIPADERHLILEVLVFLNDLTAMMTKLDLYLRDRFEVEL